MQSSFAFAIFLSTWPILGANWTTAILRELELATAAILEKDLKPEQRSGEYSLAETEVASATGACYVSHMASHGVKVAYLMFGDST